MKHSWPTDEQQGVLNTLGLPHEFGEKNIFIQSWLFCDPGIWPRTKQKKGTLMNRSWPTHEPLIKGWLYILIHSFIHSFIFHSSIHSLWVPMFFFWFLGFLRAPLDPLGFTDGFLQGFQINGYHEWFVYQLPICADCLRMSISRSFLWLLLMKNSWPTHEPLMNGRNSWTPTAR